MFVYVGAVHQNCFLLFSTAAAARNSTNIYRTWRLKCIRKEGAEEAPRSQTACENCVYASTPGTITRSSLYTGAMWGGLTGGGLWRSRKYCINFKRVTDSIFGFAKDYPKKKAYARAIAIRDDINMFISIHIYMYVCVCVFVWKKCFYIIYRMNYFPYTRVMFVFNG